MPRIVEDRDFADLDISETEREVAPIAIQLGEVPQIDNLEQILDPYAPAPSAETNATEENAHAH